eukprot:TRINITY_DN4339_c0_g1_i6.p1 TRINITY_DN4339_c0_g1~~TRINITY_DN4339_c0_g1_i6.p1  ORF type:complete len:153 (+),score=10.01 TRINITY_DN4339_c0_g1_i6:169-627(+)
MNLFGGVDLVSKILFPTPPPSYDAEDFNGDLIWIPKNLDPATSGPDDCVPCLCLVSPSSRFTVLYFHSNAEDLGRCHFFCTLLRHQFHVNVLCVEYPGYGVLPSSDTTAALVGCRCRSVADEGHSLADLPCFGKTTRGEGRLPLSLVFVHFP